MPIGLKRYQQAHTLHYITFTCYHRAPYLETPHACDLFERTLERVRRWYGFYVNAYVVMPEHVHLLISEPERSTLAVALQMLKQLVSRAIHGDAPGSPFWQRRYYDFNVWSHEKFWKNYITFIRIPCGGDWWHVRRTGGGAAFAISRLARKVSWKLNRTGRHESESGWGSFRL